MTTFVAILGNYDKTTQRFIPHRNLGELSSEDLRIAYSQMHPEEHIMIFVKTNTDRDCQTFSGSGFIDVYMPIE